MHQAATEIATKLKYFGSKSYQFAYHTSNMLRPILPRARFCLNSFRRSLVTVPEINPNFNNGVPGLLSPAGFDIAWTQYQGLMVEKLNNLIAGTPNRLLYSYHFSHARSSELALELHLGGAMDVPWLIYTQEETTNLNHQKIFSLNTLATQTPLPSSTTHQWHSTTRRPSTKAA